MSGMCLNWLVWAYLLVYVLVRLFERTYGNHTYDMSIKCFQLVALWDTLGGTFLCSTNDLITIFVALECFSLCPYLLSGYIKKDIWSWNHHKFVGGMIECRIGNNEITTSLIVTVVNCNQQIVIWQEIIFTFSVLENIFSLFSHSLDSIKLNVGYLLQRYFLDQSYRYWIRYIKYFKCTLLSNGERVTKEKQLSLFWIIDICLLFYTSLWLNLFYDPLLSYLW
jgi:hypothetical protein